MDATELVTSDTDFGTFDFGLSPADEQRARTIHDEAVIIDLLFWGPMTYRSYDVDLDRALREMFGHHGDPGRAIEEATQIVGRRAMAGALPEYRQAWDDSGVTAGQYELSVGDVSELVARAAYATALCDRLSWLTKAVTAAAIRNAKARGGHALFLHCQPSTPISRDLRLLEHAYDFGLRMLQLTYNDQDHVGSGCTERHDQGLSHFGVDVVRKLNDLGIIIDTGHCGKQTTLDACAVSDAPVIASHTSAEAVFRHDRGKSDEELQAIASTGGVIGVVTVPFFLGSGAGVSVEAWLDHVDHITATVGWEHVAIGTDWPLAGPKWVMEQLNAWALENGFRQEHNIEATRNLVGFDDYRDFPNLTRGLVSRGYRDEQVRGLLGENALRVFGQVCGA